MNIKLVKLVTGEEILCELENKDNGIVMKNPIAMMTVPGEDGQIGLGLAPWLPASKTREMPIKNEHIICIVEPSKDLHDHYNTTFGSGIVVPPDKDIIKI